MKKKIVFISMFTLLLCSLWTINANNAIGLKHDPDAGLQLDIIRENLGNISKMKSTDALEYYQEALNELFALIEEYPEHEETLEAQFYVGTTYNQMGKYNEAIRHFDIVLAQSDIDENFLARLLYFKAKALINLGKISEAKDVVARLRLIEPRAANSFGRDLSGTLRPGMAAPDFNTIDFNGNPLTLSAFKGSVVVLDFWATWSDHCLQEFPKVKKLYKTFKNRGVQFVGISLDDQIEDLKAFAGQNNIEWPQIFEGMRWRGTISKLYNVQKIPIMFVLDKKGRIQYIGNEKKKIHRYLAKLITLP